MAKSYNRDDRVGFFIGNIRDKDQLARSLQGIDYVVHAVACIFHFTQQTPAGVKAAMQEVGLAVRKNYSSGDLR